MQRMHARREYEERYGFQMPPLLFQHGDVYWVKTNLTTRRIVPKSGADFWFFLLEFGEEFFGSDFLAGELARSVPERHPAVAWFCACKADLSTCAEVARPAPKRLGGTVAWVRLAYDLFTLFDNTGIPESLKTRLLQKDQFQGARHELRVAAACISAGFRLTFQNEADNERTHFEFVAEDGRCSIAVEAKSRHRNGVQGFAGGKALNPSELTELGKDIRGLIVDAYKKETALPLYIFVDTNLPGPKDETTHYALLRTVSKTLQDLRDEGYGDPSNGIILSIDGIHYYCDDPILSDDVGFWAAACEVRAPRVPDPDPDLLNALTLSFSRRLVPPRQFKRVVVPLAPQAGDSGRQAA